MTPISLLTCCACVWPGGKLSTSDGEHHADQYYRSLLLVLRKSRTLQNLMQNLPPWWNPNGLIEGARWHWLSPTSPRIPRIPWRWAGLRNMACYDRSMEGCTRATTCMTVVILTRMALQSRGGASRPKPTDKGCDGATLQSSFAWSPGKCSVSSHENKRRAMQTTWRETITPTTVVEMFGQTALGNSMLVRNKN